MTILLLECNCTLDGSFNSSCNPSGECFCKPGFKIPNCECFLEDSGNGTLECIGKKIHGIVRNKIGSPIDNAFLFRTFAQKTLFYVLNYRSFATDGMLEC